MVTLQFPVLFRFVFVCFPSFAIGLLWKRLWFTYSCGCHLSLSKRGGWKHISQGHFSLGSSRFSSVFCGKSYHLSTKVAFSGAEESWWKDINYVLAEWRRVVKSVWPFGMGTIRVVSVVWSGTMNKKHSQSVGAETSPPACKRRTLHVDFQDLCCKHTVLPMRFSVLFCPWAKLKLKFLLVRKKKFWCCPWWICCSVKVVVKWSFPVTTEYFSWAEAFWLLEGYGETSGENFERRVNLKWDLSWE